MRPRARFSEYCATAAVRHTRVIVVPGDGAAFRQEAEKTDHGAWARPWEGLNFRVPIPRGLRGVGCPWSYLKFSSSDWKNSKTPTLANQGAGHPKEPNQFHGLDVLEWYHSCVRVRQRRIRGRMAHPPIPL